MPLPILGAQHPQCARRPVSLSSVPTLGAQHPQCARRPVSLSSVPSLGAQHPQCARRPVSLSSVPTLGAQYPQRARRPVSLSSVPTLGAQHPQCAPQSVPGQGTPEPWRLLVNIGRGHSLCLGTGAGSSRAHTPDLPRPPPPTRPAELARKWEEQVTGARVGEQPRRAHTRCAELEAGGGEGPRPHRPSTVEKELVCFPKAPSGLRRALQEYCFPARWKQDAHLPEPQRRLPPRQRLLAAGAPEAMEAPARPACDFHLPAGGRAGVPGEETLPPALPARVLAPGHLPPARLQVPQPSGVRPSPGRLPGASLSIQTCPLRSRGVQRDPEPS
ncbi:hypothetical protein ABFV05_017724 [Capra hircus]